MRENEIALRKLSGCTAQLRASEEKQPVSIVIAVCIERCTASYLWDNFKPFCEQVFCYVRSTQKYIGRRGRRPRPLRRDARHRVHPVLAARRLRRWRARRGRGRTGHGRQRGRVRELLFGGRGQIAGTLAESMNHGWAQSLRIVGVSSCTSEKNWK